MVDTEMRYGQYGNEVWSQIGVCRDVYIMIPPSVKCYAFASSPSRVEPNIAFPLEGKVARAKRVTEGRIKNIPINYNLLYQNKNSLTEVRENKCYFIFGLPSLTAL